ncbi:MAG: Fibronectin, type III [candidate division Zixibacteria bacterium RBG-1]|nr:MAG: Fibronectin, type III [candidate division Zixibacteria bacterium RBG-1]OGC86232.1 MAG: hypothetical protein A2V73_04380 [candidate division Zixibacteria bacterium RBG_19FT_COMBO_42_43]
MKIRKYIFLLFLFYSYIPVLAQVDTAWVRRYNGPGNGDDVAVALAVDKDGNSYVAGWSYGNGTFEDYTTIKYASNGDTLWVRRYNGPGNGDDEPKALAVDESGNVYVTGESDTDTGMFKYNDDFVTIKYSSSGDVLWIKQYNGSGNGDDNARDIKVDRSGNVYVTGDSYGGVTAYDYTTIKYYPNGDTAWVRRYNGPGNSQDGAWAISVDGSGNVYVTGYSAQNSVYPYNEDYATVKYDQNGNQLWVRRYNGPAGLEDYASGMGLDGTGNIYVTGESRDSISYDDYLTIKYYPNGDTAWIRRWDGPGNDDDDVWAIAVDSVGNVYLAGETEVAPLSPNYDFATIKYYASGEIAWVKTYGGPVHYGQANGIALDSVGNVYVTGFSGGSGDFDYATIKYSPNGDSVWAIRYNGPGNSYDDASAIIVDQAGYVYVTGESQGSGSSLDYATIKYKQCLAKPGDANADGNILLPDIITIINFLFRSGAAPNPLCRGDANGNGNVLLPDIVYLINYIFKSGPAPLKSKECCL